jgi:16S rRNA (uracil1498-N3)-methyltransferase
VTERRFYVEPGAVSAERLTLRNDEAHHARRVLRLDVGDTVTCFDGRGAAWRGQIAGIAKDRVEVTIVETLPVVAEPTPRITLAQGLVKGERMDWIVQKATELGASCIQPLRTDRSEVRLDDARAERRAERWHRIAVEASKQCERAWLPELAEPLTVAGALARLDGPAVAFVERDAEPARPALEALRGAERLAVFVGPEGGWTGDELAALAAAAVPCLSLGPQILRAETAAVAALAIVAYAVR